VNNESERFAGRARARARLLVGKEAILRTAIHPFLARFVVHFGDQSARVNVSRVYVPGNLVRIGPALDPARCEIQSSRFSL